MILSISGWRKVFDTEGEYGRGGDLRLEDRYLIATAAQVFRSFLARRVEGRAPRIVVARDTRPTGRLICDIAVRVLIGLDAEVVHLGIAATPEMTAFTRAHKNADGFFYASASHNPPGHNGIKFGLNDGQVLGAEDAGELIAVFRKVVATEQNAEFLLRAINTPSERRIDECYGLTDGYKREALTEYGRLSWEIAAFGAEGLEDRLKEAVAKRALGVLCDFNGSARITSIDRDFLGSLGIDFRSMNDRPGGFVHEIVPEGESLEPCRRALEEAHSQDPHFLLGYVPDCDGDRGNLTYIDSADGRAKLIHAQEVFALACLAELSYLAGLDRETAELAVVCNGPTSLRVDRLAERFGAKVHRAEVGEANVLALAAKLDSEGVLVRIIGEGSNGGNITLPGRVRDPLSTILSVTRYLRLPAGSPGQTPTPAGGGATVDRAAERGDIGGALASLPRFQTTGAYEKRALLRIQSSDHGALKRAYEKLLEEGAVSEGRLAQRFGIASYRILNFEGTETREGAGNRTGDERGGFQLRFSDAAGKDIGFVWMRGSRTEPVFRVMADLATEDPALEAELLDWHVGLVRRADEAASEGPA